MAEEEGASPGPGRAVEVLGAPPELPDMLLLLYFENRRRSGGGPVKSCRRRGGRAVLTFEAADDAQRVLSRSDHVLQDHRLEVRPAAPRDNQKLLLWGLDPGMGLELLELYVERMLNCESGSYRIYRSRAGDQALVQLQEPLSDAEFPALVERVQSRPLDGVSLAVEWLEQTNSLLVRSCDGSQLQADLLELYFESKRSGGGQVLSVRVLQGGRMAVVSFQDCAVAGRVLLRPHQLAKNVLDVSPYYDFLEPEEEAEPQLQPGARGRASPVGNGAQQTVVPVPDAAIRQLLRQSERVLRELGGAVPECALRLDEAGLRISGGGPADRHRLQQHIQAALQRVEQEQLPFAAWDLCFLRREDVRTCLAQRLDEQGLGACYVPMEQEVLVVGLGPSAARQAASLLGSCLSPFTLPLSERQLLALTSPRWEQVQEALHCCLVRLAESEERLEGLTLAELEQENTARLLAFLQDSVPDETLVAMEPGALSYLQRHYQEVLAGIANVTLLPLEGTDITGLRLSGEAQACQAAAELLHSLLGAIHSRTVQLKMPGVNRFLLDERGQALVQALEKRFPCTVGLEKVCWRPMEAQHDLEMSQEPLALSCRRDNLQPPGGAVQTHCEVSTEEIKDLLAALQPLPVPDAEAEAGSLAGDELNFVPAPVPDPVGSVDPSVMEEGALLCPGKIAGARRPLEEEAQLFLAIQQSMDTAQREEDEFQRATELSLRSWEQERARSPDAALLSAVSLSLQDAEQDVGSAELVLYVAAEAVAEAASQELEAALRAQLREETVHSRALQSLPPLGLDYLNHLERKHAVRISVAGSVATVCGFADYPVAATRDLALLLTRLLRAEEGRGAVEACWVHWDAPGSGSPIPYSAEASALLEQAWRGGSKRLDVFFDGRPFTVDFERMEEYDLSNARTVPIGRTEPPLCPALQGEPGSLAAQEEVKLVQLAEGSEEFQETVRLFYRTLEDFYSRICIVKVEKLLHPLLYQQYQLKKAAMEKGSGQQKVERVLFHGTTEQASREICQHGFNRSFCGRNATFYGHGVYFAAKAFISAQDKYSPCGSNGDKYIFVARTLVGEFTAGNQSMRAPPLRPGSDTQQRYDSTVDNPRDPTIFVIFNDTQAYPQYLITCRWSRDR